MQASLTDFFLSRKRSRAQEPTLKSKVVLLEQDTEGKSNVGETGSAAASSTSTADVKGVRRVLVFQKEVVKQGGEASRSSARDGVAAVAKKLTEAKGSPNTVSSRKIKKTGKVSQQSILKAFSNQSKSLKHVESQAAVPSDLTKGNGGSSQPTETKKESKIGLKTGVTFEKLGNLSPRKMIPILASEAHLEATGSDEKPTTSGSVKKLTPGVLKAELRKCKKLSELRSTLLKFNEGSDKLKQLQESAQKSPQLKKFQSIQFDVPVITSPQKASILTKSPAKTPEKLPAYEKYHHLAVSGLATTLTLPFKYKFLLHAFHCLETIITILHNRQEVISFEKLKQPVQELLGKTFTLNHLAQIKRIFPTAYVFTQEKNIPRFGHGFKKADSFHLTLTVNFDYRSAVEDGGSQRAFQMMSPTILVERKRIFQANLLEMVKFYHEEFLKELNLPVEVDNSKVTRWHPDFNVDEVPNVEPDPLPLPPQTEKCTSAKDVLEKANGLLDCNNRMAEVLKGKTEKTEDSALPAPPVTTEAVSLALKGVNQSLLDKIRAKQAARLLREMTRCPEENKELERMCRLPEMARILRNTFLQEKKSSLPMEVAVEKLTNSYRSALAHHDVEEHICLLARLLPDWLVLHTFSRGKFLKVSKDVDINLVVQKLEKITKNNI